MRNAESRNQQHILQQINTAPETRFLPVYEQNALAFLQRVTSLGDKGLDEMPPLYGNDKQVNRWARKHGINQEILATHVSFEFVEKYLSASPRLRELAEGVAWGDNLGHGKPVLLKDLLSIMQFEMDERREMAKITDIFQETDELFDRYFPELRPTQPVKLFAYYGEYEFPQQGSEKFGTEAGAIHLGSLDGTYYIGIKLGDILPSELRLNPLRRQKKLTAEEQEKLHIDRKFTLAHERVHQKQAEIQPPETTLHETSMDSVLEGEPYTEWSANKIARTYLKEVTKKVSRKYQESDGNIKGILASAIKEAVAIQVELAMAEGEMDRLAPSSEALMYYDYWHFQQKMLTLVQASRGKTYTQSIVFDNAQAQERPLVPPLAMPYLIGLFDIMPKLYGRDDPQRREKAIALCMNLDMEKLYEIAYESDEWNQVLADPQRELQNYVLAA